MRIVESIKCENCRKHFLYFFCKMCYYYKGNFIYFIYAPVAQGIEHRPPEAGAAVRIRPGVYLKKQY